MSNKNLDTNNKKAQETINKRLDRMRFSDISGTDFDAGVGTHADNLVSFVTRSASTVELYKGDTKISGTGVERDVMTTTLPHGRDFLWKTPVDSTGTTTLGTTDIETLHETRRYREENIYSYIKLIPFRGGMNNTKIYRAAYIDPNAYNGGKLSKFDETSETAAYNPVWNEAEDNSTGYTYDYNSKWSRSSYSQLEFYIRRIVNGEVSSDREFFRMTIFPGAFRPITELHKGTGMTYYDSHMYNCLPAIDIWHQRQINGSWYTMKNYKYIARPSKTTSNRGTGQYLPYSEYTGPSLPMFSVSLEDANTWPLTYTWNENTNGYNSAFATCGLIAVFEDSTINVVENGSTYDVKNGEWLYKPSIGVVSKCSWYDSAKSKRVTHDARLSILPESSSAGLRLGLKYSLETGNALDDYTIDSYINRNGEMAAINYITEGGHP